MFFSQKDPKWAKEKLGSCSTTLGASSCYITSLCNLNTILNFMGEINPSEMNKLCIKYGFYQDGCMLKTADLAKFLKLTYEKTTVKPKDTVCILETNFYKAQGVPQHFVLYDTNTGGIVDPLSLSPTWSNNKYSKNIVSYRVFRASVSVPDPDSTSLPTTPVITAPSPNSDATSPIPINAVGGVVWTGTAVPEKEDYEKPAYQVRQMVEDLIALFKKLIAKIWKRH